MGEIFCTKTEWRNEREKFDGHKKNVITFWNDVISVIGYRDLNWTIETKKNDEIELIEI